MSIVSSPSNLFFVRFSFIFVLCHCVCSFPSSWLCLPGDFFSASLFDWVRVNTSFLVGSIMFVVSFFLFGSVFLAYGVS